MTLPHPGFYGWRYRPNWSDPAGTDPEPQKRIRDMQGDERQRVFGNMHKKVMFNLGIMSMDILPSKAYYNYNDTGIANDDTKEKPVS